MSTFHALSVAEVAPETEDAITLKFVIPKDLAGTFQAMPGQHIKLRSRIDDKEVERFYSICDIGENHLRVGIKRVEDSVFSGHACQMLKVGDKLEVMAPQGDFCLPIDDAKAMDSATHYLFVAAGSGVTPMLAMISYLLEHTKHTQIDFIYVNAKRKSVMFFEELEALKNRHMGRLSVIHILTREPRDLDLLSARPEGERVDQLLDAFIDHQNLDHTYLCGPLPLIEGFRSALIDKGVDKKTIHMELFGTPSVSTKPRQQSQSPTTDDMVITIISGGREQSITLTDDQYVLDAALDAGANVPFACKGGVCATCKAKMVTGDAQMDVNYGLEDDEVAKGYVLTCQARVTSATAVVDFDV